MSVQLAQLQPWWQAARVPAHPMLALPMLWGQGLAWQLTGAFDWRWLLLAQLYAVFCQLFIVYLNDHADEAVDRLNRTYWLSGGSRVIPEGKLAGQQLFRGALLALLAMALLAILATLVGRPWMPLFWLVGTVLAWTYSLPPLQTSYRGQGEWHQAISCGLFLPMLGWYLQTGHLQGLPWLALLPLLMLFYSANIVTALADTPSDRAGGKRSYPVRHGERRARRDAMIIQALACISAPLLSPAGPGDLLMISLVSAPALIPLVGVALSDLPDTANAERRDRCRQFVLWLSLSHGWLLGAWTLLLLVR